MLDYQESKLEKLMAPLVQELQPYRLLLVALAPPV